MNGPGFHDITRGNGSGLALPGQQPQVMIGVDPSLSAVTSDRQILRLAGSLYVQRKDLDPERDELDSMKDACVEAMALFDTLQTTIEEWAAAKKEAEAKTPLQSV